MQTARWGLQVFAGIAGLVAQIGLLVGVFSFFPSVLARQVEGYELPFFILGMGVFPAIAVWIARGPKAALLIDDERLALVEERDRRVMAEIPLRDLEISEVDFRSGYVRHRGIELSWAARRRPLRIAGLVGSTQFRWRHATVIQADPDYLVPTEDWPEVLERLDLTRRLARPSEAASV